MASNLLLILLAAILVVQQCVPCIIIIIIILCVVKMYVLLSTIEIRSLTIAMWKTLSRHNIYANIPQYVVLRTLRLFLNIYLKGDFITTGNKFRVIKEKALELILFKMRYCPLLFKKKCDNTSGGCSLKLVKLKLQVSSLARSPSNALGESLVMCQHVNMFLKNKNSKRIIFKPQSANYYVEVCQTVK
jgi:hypothetical protein